MTVYCNTTPLIALASIGRLDTQKAQQAKLIPSFKSAAQAMRAKGIFYSTALVARLAAQVGE